MLNNILNFLNSNGLLIMTLLYIVYIMFSLIIKAVKNKGVDVNTLFSTLKKIPKLMSQAELIFPSKCGADKLSYVTNLIKLLINEENPNSVLLTYDWDSLVQTIFTETQKINAKEEK